MTYTEAIDYLLHQLPLFSRIGSAAYKKDLTNIILLCSALGDPHRQFKSIHVAGTNGKGSVSHMLAAILQTAGYKTGLYTSPHLYDFRERIRINGQMVEEQFVSRFVEQIKPLANQIEPSFFELTVAMAFTWYAEQKIDVAVIEVGLGGRLDSTNIITPEVSVITNISLDHTNILGPTVQEIAAEKGGIIKEGIPVVIGEKKEETMAVFTGLAQQKKAPIYFAEEYFSIQQYQMRPDRLQVLVKNKQSNQLSEYELDLPGLYQLNNLMTVLQTTELLKQCFPIAQDVPATALQQVKKLTGLHGRWELIGKEPLTVLDVAHNEEGIRRLLQHVQQLSFHKLHLIVGFVKEKDSTAMLQLFPPEAQYYFTQAHIPRALPAEVIYENALQMGLTGSMYATVNEALQQAAQNAVPEDLIIVCGSLFLVAEVDRKLFNQYVSSPKRSSA